MKRFFVVLLIISMLVQPQTVYAQTNTGSDETFSDIEGHWAEETITELFEKGRISGYTDGTFKPDSDVTIAEAMTLINSYLGLDHDISGYLEEGAENEKWYDSEVAMAEYYGYLETLDSIPEEDAERIDILIMMSLLIDYKEEEASGERQYFSDLEQYDETTQELVTVFSEMGYINGYDDNTFKPSGTITRAELLAILDNMVGYVVTSEEDLKHIPPETKKITIIDENIVLEDLVMDVDVYISPGVEGNVKIKNCNINGQIMISGGSDQQAIEIENSQVEKVVVTKSKDIPMIEIKGMSHIEELKTKTETSITLSDETVVNEVQTEVKTELKLNKGTQITNLVTRGETTVVAEKGSKIETLQAEEKTEITGTGKISKAYIESEGVNIESQPSYIKIDEEVEKVVIGDEKISSDHDDKPSSSSNDDRDDSPRDTVAPTGYSVNIDQGIIHNTTGSALSFTFAGAEVGASYHYSVDDDNDATPAETGSGKIRTTTDRIRGIDVSGLDNGTLTLTVYLIDTSLNQGGDVTDTVKKDTSIPSGYSVHIDQGAVDNTTGSAISFTFAGADVGATYHYSVDDTNDSTSAQTGSGTISTPADQITGIDVSGLDDGILTLTVYLTGTSSNQGANVTDTVTKDTTSPTGYSVSIDQGVINDSNKTALSFTFANAEVGALFNYSIKDTNSGTPTVRGNGIIGTATDQISNIDVSGLDDDTLTLIVHLTDTAGHQGATVKDTVVKEATAPSAYGVNIDQSIIDNTNKTAISFTFTEAEVGATYDYSIDDTNNGTSAVTGSGKISTSTDQITNIDVSGLGDGILTLTVYLTDTSSNQGSKVTDTVTKDTTSPTGYSVNIDQSAINNNNKTALSFTLENAEVGATYHYSIDDNNGGTPAVTSGGAITIATEKINDIDVSGLDDDTLTLTLYLTDIAANQGSNVADSVTKETVAPAGYSVNIDQAKITGSNETALSFTFTNAEIGTTYNYSIDDANSVTSAVTGNGTISTLTDKISNINVSGLDDGTLTLTVYLTDSVGNQGSNTTATVVKDATGPTGYAVNIDQGYINNSNKTALSFTFSGAEADATYYYSIDDTNSGTTPVTGNGTISTATDTISNIDVSGLVDDTLTLTVYLTDTFTNQGYNATDTVTKDVVAPSGYTVNIDQSLINNSNKTALSFTFANAEDGATYNYSIDDANISTNAVTGSNTVNSATQQISNVDISGLDDSTLTLTVYQTDMAGNQGSDTTDTVTKETIPPSGYTVNIDQSYINDSNKSALSFTFASAEVGATYNYSIDDTNSGTTPVTNSGTINSATQQISNIDVSGLDDDTLTLTVYLTDTNSNQGSNATDTVTKDVVAPSGYTVSIDQSYANNTNKSALSFTFANAEHGATYNYSIDDANAGTTAVTGNATISSASQQISNIDVSSLDDGTLTLTAILSDTYSNQGSSVMDTVTKDVVSPSGYSVSIDQAKINASNEDALSFTFANAGIGTTYNYSIDDSNGSTMAVTGNGTISTLTDQISNINVSGLDDDTLTLTVYLTDTAGNQGSNATDTVTKDTTAPSGYSVNIDPGYINNSNKTALSFTFSGAEADATYYYSIDDTNSGTTAVTNSGTISSATQQISNIDVSGLDDDTLTLTVTLTDTFSNQGSNATDTVIKDIVAPSGYTVNIDQNLINSSNKTALSFTIANAEAGAGATYNYSIDDANISTSAVTGSNTVNSATQQISNVDVSGLDDDTLTLTVYLTDAAGNQGSNTTDTVTKEATPPSGYSVNIDQGYINNNNKTVLSFTFESAEVGATYNYNIDDTNGSTTTVTNSGTINSATQQISNIDVSGLDDDTLTLTVYLTDTNSNQGSNATDNVTKDIVAPSGYTVNIDQGLINSANQTVLSFTFANAEVDATYNYSIDDTSGSTTATTGTATVNSATQQISNINVSNLNDDTLTLTVYLTDPSGNQGTNTTDTVSKDATAPTNASGYPKVDTATGTGFTVKAKINENGTAFYVVVANGAAEPTSAEVKAGTANSGSAALKSGNIALTANVEGSSAVTGLSDGTDYDVYVVSEDGIPNLQSSPVKVNITTLDTTAPTDASGYPKADTVTGNGATVRAKTDESGTAYYVIVADGASAPTAAEVKAGTGNGGAAAVENGTISLTADTEGTDVVTSLASETSYDVYIVSEDGSSNLQSSASKVDITTSDITAPSNSLGYPKADSANGSGFTVKAKTTEDGKAYYVVLTNNATAPGSAEVKAGLANGGGAALKSGSIALTANIEGSSAVTGLSGGTNYDVYVVSEDGTPNIQSSPTKIDIATTSSIPTSLTVSVTGNWAPYDEAGTYTKLEDDYNSTGRPRYRYISGSDTYYMYWSSTQWIIKDSYGNLHTNSNTSTAPPKTGWDATDPPANNTQATASY